MVAKNTQREIHSKWPLVGTTEWIQFNSKESHKNKQLKTGEYYDATFTGGDKHLKKYYHTDVSIVPPFFHMKFVRKWGVGLYTGERSDTKIHKLNTAHNTLFLSQFVFVYVFMTQGIS